MELTQSQVVRLDMRLTGLQILTFRLLALPLAQLEEEIEDALAENPCLERLDAPRSRSDDDRPRTTTAANPSSESETLADEAPDRRDIDFGSPAERTPVSTEAHEPFPLENFSGATPSLADHLLEQLRHTARDKDIRVSGEAIIWNLDDNGYLRAELAEIAAATETSVAIVERALALVQTFDPTGVAARDLRECLQLQLRADPDSDPITLEIVGRHCDALGRRRYEYLARVFRVPMARILAAVERIRHLDPKPGRAFGAADVRPVRPEVTVEKVNGDYVVSLNDHGLPALGVARGFRGLRQQLSTEERRFLSERRQAARWFLEAIERRRQTLRRVVETMVRLQRDFFDHGPASLRPLILRQVAEAISMHESTVSRATSSKYVDTPHGVFPLKHFFQMAIPSVAGDLVATATVKTDLRAVIAAEDRSHPLSDLALAAALRQRGLAVARRTVAKYRGELGIPPSHQRKTMTVSPEDRTVCGSNCGRKFSAAPKITRRETCKVLV
jgi:RNA polymerase sigma-54 factor